MENKTHKFLRHIIDSFSNLKEKVFKVEIDNCNEIQFRWLQVKECTETKQFFMKLAPYGCCLVPPCMCDDDEDEDFEGCECPSPCQHKDLVCQTSGDSIAACYKLMLQKMHHIYKCNKCREVTQNQCQISREELICTSCLFHEDVYCETEEFKKKFLFDCYVCKEDNINRKHMMKLTCAGADKHSADMCKFCYRLNGSKCPLCRT